jgi:hypothetical protein
MHGIQLSVETEVKSQIRTEARMVCGWLVLWHALRAWLNMEYWCKDKVEVELQVFWDKYATAALFPPQIACGHLLSIYCPGILLKKKSLKPRETFVRIFAYSTEIRTGYLQRHFNHIPDKYQNSTWGINRYVMVLNNRGLMVANLRLKLLQFSLRHGDVR